MKHRWISRCCLRRERRASGDASQREQIYPWLNTIVHRLNEDLNLKPQSIDLFTILLKRPPSCACLSDSKVKSCLLLLCANRCTIRGNVTNTTLANTHQSWPPEDPIAHCESLFSWLASSLSFCPSTCRPPQTKLWLPREESLADDTTRAPLLCLRAIPPHRGLETNPTLTRSSRRATSSSDTADPSSLPYPHCTRTRSRAIARRGLLRCDALEELGVDGACGAREGFFYVLLGEQSGSMIRQCAI